MERKNKSGLVETLREFERQVAPPILGAYFAIQCCFFALGYIDIHKKNIDPEESAEIIKSYFRDTSTLNRLGVTGFLLAHEINSLRSHYKNKNSGQEERPRSRSPSNYSVLD